MDLSEKLKKLIKENNLTQKILPKNFLYYEKIYQNRKLKFPKQKDFKK